MKSSINYSEQVKSKLLKGVEMSIYNFDDKLTEEKLKVCPEIVQVYVKLLKENRNKWKDIAHKAFARLFKS